MRNKVSIKNSFLRIVRDERERKPFIVGLVVFFVVFAGLMIYHQAAIEPKGDVILTNGNETEQTASVDGFEAEQISSSNEAETASDTSFTQNTGDIVEPVTIFVDVGGAVNISGLFALPPGSRVADAIDAAGGMTEYADITYLNRATLLNDGDRVYVPTAAEIKNGTVPPSAGMVTISGGYTGNTGDTSAGSGTSAVQSLININTANSEELQKLNGVGPATAQKIIDYRTSHGGFKRIDELMNVSGIGTKTYEKLKDHVTV